MKKEKERFDWFLIRCAGSTQPERGETSRAQPETQIRERAVKDDSTRETRRHPLWETIGYNHPVTIRIRRAGVIQLVYVKRQVFFAFDTTSSHGSRWSLVWSIYKRAKNHVLLLLRLPPTERVRKRSSRIPHTIHPRTFHVIPHLISSRSFPLDPSTPTIAQVPTTAAAAVPIHPVRLT